MYSRYGLRGKIGSIKWCHPNCCSFRPNEKALLRFEIQYEYFKSMSRTYSSIHSLYPYMYSILQ